MVFRGNGHNSRRHDSYEGNHSFHAVMYTGHEGPRSARAVGIAGKNWYTLKNRSYVQVDLFN